MLKKSLITLGSWLVGILAVVGIILFYKPQDFAATFQSIGMWGLIWWIALTIVARVCATEATVAPLAVLGFHMSRADGFWISWVRTFVNQITPIAGAAAYAHMIRRHVGIPWSKLAALGQPQILLVAAAIGLVGLTATVLNFERLHASAYGLLLFYAGILIVSLAFATGAHWLVEALPKALSTRAEGTSDALRAMSGQPNLIVKLLLFHVVATLLRGGRVWILFAAAGFSFDLKELLLVAAITESSLLVNITPANLGVREGAVLGGAALVGVDASVASSVALIDRLLMVALTTLLAAPAFAILRQPRQS